jgi:hypothetical protein
MTLDTNKMIARLMSKGHSKTSATELLNEILETSFGTETIIHSLLHFNAITPSQAEKMVA